MATLNDDRRWTEGNGSQGRLLLATVREQYLHALNRSELINLVNDGEVLHSFRSSKRNSKSVTISVTSNLAAYAWSTKCR
jgi:hypothetical protein